MLLHVRINNEDEKKQPKSYHCANCGTYITDSAAITKINGSESHSFVNPVGVQCNFRTFFECHNVWVSDELILEHSWFPGYGWRFLMCSNCSGHLGWKYDAVKKTAGTKAFYGVLTETLEEVTERG